MKTRTIYILLAVLLSTIAQAQTSVEKPDVLKFGANLNAIKNNLSSLGYSFTEENVEPIQLPTAKESQIQLNVEGFMYAGKARKAELIFADRALDMVWILTTAEEEKILIAEFEKLHGSPTHLGDDVTFFLNDGAAVRNQPHEVLFISDRLKEPYRQFLENR